jgi:Ni,Fe-hydrogenase I cytochrome b subunit
LGGASAIDAPGERNLSHHAVPDRPDIGSPILTTSGEPANHFLMGRIREVHLAAGIIFAISFLVRVYWFWAGNNYARFGFPMVWKKSWWQDLFTQMTDYLRLQRGHVHLGHNALGGTIYTVFVIISDGRTFSPGWLCIRRRTRAGG